MSHFTEMKTNLKSLTGVVKAVRRLNMDILESAGTKLFAQGFMDNRIESVAVIKTGTRYDIGIVQNPDGSLDLAADWELLEKCSDLKKDEFVRSVKRQYALITIEEMAKEKGLEISTPIVSEDGSMEVTVGSSW